MKQTAIVIGATGLVGRALVAQLAQNDGVERIVTLTRRAVEYHSPKVENHVLDFAQLARHAELFRGDVLFSCLGTTRQQAGSIAAQRLVDVDYQFAAAQLAAQQGVRHYVLVSSSGADASSRNAYLQMKGELEQKVSALPFARISIVQPSLLLGERTERRVADLPAPRFAPLSPDTRRGGGGEDDSHQPVTAEAGGKLRSTRGAKRGALSSGRVV